ncbi:MAG: carboxypeptidase-like regulatory domain-containing protein, partial [Armatimonadota bacterium]
EGQPLADIGTAAFLVNPAAGFVGGYESDENGDVLIGPLPAYVELRIQLHPDLTHLALDDAWWSGEGRASSLKPGEVYELEPVRLDIEGRSVTGWVLDRDGEPVAGATVAAFRPQYPTNEVLTDEQGRFALTRLAIHGDTWLIASHPTDSLYAAVAVDPDAGGEAALTLRPPTSVSGRVLDGQGEAVPDAEVRAGRSVGLQDVTGEVHTFWHAPWIPRADAATTDAEGFFRIDGLVSGAPCSVGVQAPGLRYDSMQTRFVADADDPVDLGPIQPLQ